jgi:hypothetical protein
VYSMNESLGNVEHTAFVESRVSEFLTQHSNFDSRYTTNCDELSQIIKELKTRKSPGVDGIRNIVLRNLTSFCLSYIVEIMNACFKRLYFPSVWKVAKVIPLSKPGKDASVSTNYRPISLLSGLSKAFERLIAVRLRNFLDEEHVLQDFQFGFRPKHSTVHALLHVHKHVSSALRRKESTGAMLLDIEKAFDTVWHQGLLYKLISLKIPYELIILIKSYLTNRKFFVNLNNEKSKILNVNASVPQGSVLGPILFTIYISDLPVSSNIVPSIFADDTALLYSHQNIEVIKSTLMHEFTGLRDYYDRWKIRLNVSKTEFILFTKKRQNNLLNVAYNGHVMNQVSEAKYLGVKFKRNFLFNDTVRANVVKTNDCLRLVYPLLKRNSQLNVLNKLLIFKLYIRPLMTYAIAVWNRVIKTEMNKLQIIQNKCLRMILDLHPHPVTHKQIRTNMIHEMAGIETINQFAQRITNNLYQTMNIHHNSLINGLTVLSPLEVNDSPFAIILT